MYNAELVKTLTNTDDAASLNAHQLATVAVEITGTWTGTLLFEYSIDGQVWHSLKDHRTLVTQTTVNGNFIFSVVGAKEIRVRFNPASSGSAVVYLFGKEEALPAPNSGIGSSSLGRATEAYEALKETADATTAVNVKAAVTGKSIYITDITISVDTAMWVKLQDNAGSPNEIVTKKYLPANSVWSKTYAIPKQVVSGNRVDILASVAGNISVDMNGYAI